MKLDTNLPLRENVRLLGSILGNVIAKQEGTDRLTQVEEIRSFSKAARGGDVESWNKLKDKLSNMETSQATSICRAFAQFLALANIAEQHHRLRRRREYLRKGEPQRGSLASVLPSLLAQGISPEQLYSTISELDIELVLTAHPTEVNRRTLLQKYNQIAQILAQMDKAESFEKPECVENLERLVTEIWCSNELHREKPTPLDEARAGLLIFESRLWNAIPKYLRILDRALQATVGKPLPMSAAPIRFASWMGGDRDGNPNVKPLTTRKAWGMARWIAADLYWQEVDKLRSELSLSKASAALMARVEDTAEPYRELLRTVRDRLQQTREWAAKVMEGELPSTDGVYTKASQLRAPLQLCYDSLTEVGCENIANGRLKDILRRLSTFGLCLVRLDIRQDSDLHTETMDCITQQLSLGSYKEWTEQERQAFLLQELESRRPLIPSDLVCSPEVRDVLDTFTEIAQAPDETLGAYVISMATRPSDVLLVSLLQKEAGVKAPLRVVPLFETLSDLEGAHQTVETLLNLPVWKGRKKIEIMLGYSDSAKDAGRLAASWALYTAQERLAAVCKQHGAKLILFHGRGGTVGRGGGPMSLAIRSQPPGTVNGSLRVTEQGEMIQAKFGLERIAIRTLEVYTTSVAETTLYPPKAPKNEWREAMDTMAQRSLTAYREIVRGHPDFVPYFRSATPEMELGRLNIGSRPARRRKGGGVESLRAIPWVFAWTQTRLLLPSWLGIGKAFHASTEEVYQEMAKEWPFFASTLDLISMVLAKALPDIAEYYEQLLVTPELHPLGAELRERCQMAINGILAITGKDSLLSNNPVLQRSIELRNPYVDPINLLQAELLRRIRQPEINEQEKQQLADAVMLSINGIAHGMRNTG